MASVFSVSTWPSRNPKNTPRCSVVTTTGRSFCFVGMYFSFSGGLSGRFDERFNLDDAGPDAHAGVPAATVGTIPLLRDACVALDVLGSEGDGLHLVGHGDAGRQAPGQQFLVDHLGPLALGGRPG